MTPNVRQQPNNRKNMSDAALAWAKQQQARLDATKMKQAARVQAENARRVEAVKKLIELAVEEGREVFEYSAGIGSDVYKLLEADFIRVTPTNVFNAYKFSFLIE